MVSSIGSSSNYQSQIDQIKGLTDYLNEDDDSDYDISGANSTATLLKGKIQSLTSKASNKSGYTNSSKETATSALKRALKELSTKTNEPITFRTIEKYREELETELTLTVRLGVVSKGVDADTAFSLNLDADGQISVTCDNDKEKKLVEEYLEENKKVCDKFGYIQALSTLQRAEQANYGSALYQSTKGIQAECQSEAIENFFSTALSDNTNVSTLIANFMPEEEKKTSYYTGINVSV